MIKVGDLVRLNRDVNFEEFTFYGRENNESKALYRALLDKVYAERTILVVTAIIDTNGGLKYMFNGDDFLLELEPESDTSIKNSAGGNWIFLPMSYASLALGRSIDFSRSEFPINRRSM